MKRFVMLLAAVVLAGLPSGCDGRASNAGQLSQKEKQQPPGAPKSNAAQREHALVGQSATCEQPPATITLDGMTFTFAKRNAAEEPVMNLGYVACSEGIFVPGDGGPGTLIVYGTAPRDGKTEAVIFIGRWGNALYTADGQHAADKGGRG